MTATAALESGGADRHRYEVHRSVHGGTARAAVFGVSDGLVTNVSLIIGLAGAHPAATTVRLAGLAALIAGACSMAVGELVSMGAQRALQQRELDVERREIQQFPEAEHRELALIYQRRGLAPDLAHQVATAMMRDEHTAVETHAREELGIDPSDLGSPAAAAASSFVSFAVGAAVPLAPWLATAGTGALVATVVLGALMSFLVGAALARFTRRGWFWAAIRQLGLSALAAGIAFGVGTGIGHTTLR